MPEFNISLGKYATEVLSAYGVTILLFAVLGVISWRQSVKSKRALEAAEARRAQKNG